MEQKSPLEVTVMDTVGLAYWQHLPAGYIDISTQHWPLLLYLHGRGERGNDLEAVARHGPPRLLREGKKLPLIVLAPQCPHRYEWVMLINHLAALLEVVCERLWVDRRRIYLTGNSMGGFGAWHLAQRYPERFAALVPICGGGDPDALERIARLPVWAFHGADDAIIAPMMTQRMVDGLRALGADVRLTLYAGVGHDAWTPAYADPALWAWLLAQRREES